MMENRKLNCPNCGAPIQEDKCPYCGTVIYDFATLETDKPCYIKIKMGGKIIMLQAVCRGFSITMERHDIDYYGDDRVIHTVQAPDINIDMSFIANEDRGVLYKVKILEE